MPLLVAKLAALFDYVISRYITAVANREERLSQKYAKLFLDRILMIISISWN